MGCLGIDPEAFFDLTPRAFQLAAEAYQERIQADQRATMEAARLTGWLSARPAMSEKAQKRYNHPALYCPFPWDEKIPNRQLIKVTDEDMAKAMAWATSSN